MGKRLANAIAPSRVIPAWIFRSVFGDSLLASFFENSIVDMVTRWGAPYGNDRTTTRLYV